MTPNRPRGRQKNVTGTGKPIKRRGSGLGTGPVGGAGRGAGIGGGSHRPSGGSFNPTPRPQRSYGSGSSGGFGKLIILILVLLFGFFTVGVTISDSMFRTNFNLSWITAYSALIRYGSGTMVARLMLPVGAIAYFLSNRTKPGKTPSREIEEPAETEQTDNAE